MFNAKSQPQPAKELTLQSLPIFTRLPLGASLSTGVFPLLMAECVPDPFAMTRPNFSWADIENPPMVAGSVVPKLEVERKGEGLSYTAPLEYAL